MTRLFGSQLSEEQLIERRKGIGASDAAKILAGGEAWADLFLDKTGRKAPKSILSPWDAAIRHVTEGLQCDWHEHKTGEHVVFRGAARQYGEWGVLRCTLDGQVEIDMTVFECKHVSQFTPDPIRWCTEHYSPQIHHQMIVTGTDKAIMSVMVGMNEPQLVTFTLDPFWAEVYIARCREFWKYVETDTPPPGAEPMPAPIPFEDMRVVDFSESNEFGNFAAQWVENQEASKKFAKATEGIKKLIPADCKEATGHNLKVTRSKAGALTIKQDKK